MWISCILHALNCGPSHNPDMCPDWESNQWPFGLQADIHSTEPYQPVLIIHICLKRLHLFFFFWARAVRQGERNGEKHQYTRETSIGCLSHAPTGDVGHNAGTCPEQELNRQSWFMGQHSVTEPHQPGLSTLLNVKYQLRRIWYYHSAILGL